MPRSRRDGSQPREANRKKLTELDVTKTRPDPDRVMNIWDTQQKGLVLQIQPSGFRSYRVCYSRNGKPRWMHIANARAIGLAQARELAQDIMYQVAKGKDPVAEKRAGRDLGTFKQLHSKYLEHAKKVNKSWEQANFLVERFTGKITDLMLPRSSVKTSRL